MVGLELTSEELDAVLEIHAVDSNGLVDYAAFLPVAHESIVYMYNQKDQHISMHLCSIMCSLQHNVYFTLFAYIARVLMLLRLL